MYHDSAAEDLVNHVVEFNVQYQEAFLYRFRR